MEKVWYQHYDPGVPHTVNPDQYTSLVHVMEESFQRYSDRNCFINMGVALTYRDLDEKSRAFAGFLQTEFNMKKGDRLAIMMPSVLQYPVAVFGALRAGLIVVNLNPLSTYKELNHALKNTGAKAILVFENFGYLLEAAMPSTNIEHVIYTKMGDLFPFVKRHIVNFVVKKIKKMVPRWYIPGAVPFRKTIDSKYTRLFSNVPIDRNDIACLQMSAGRKSGWENCVMLTHRNFIANMLQASFWLESFFMKKHPGNFFNPFPFSRTLCMTLSFFMIRIGVAAVLVTNPRDIASMVSAIKKDMPSLFFGINSIFIALLKNEEFCKLDFSKLRTTFAGGTGVQTAVAEKWKKVTNCSIMQGYGLVEAAPIVSCEPFSRRVFTGRVGYPMPSTDVKICDDNGQALPVDTIGELWVKGPQVMKGYWNDEAKTKEVLTSDGWLKTGDMASIDSGGSIKIIDRKEDVMMIQGQTVFSTEVEDVIATIDGVYEVGVIAVPTEKGDVIKAAIVRNNPNLTEEIIIATCKNKLQPHQVPRIVEFYSALPKSMVGYVLRRVLREEVLLSKKPWGIMPN